MSGSGSAVFGLFQNEIDLAAHFPKDVFTYFGKLTPQNS
jgi:4-diphosphocytidyl-2C-methyl-D-erythritol kinase